MAKGEELNDKQRVFIEEWLKDKNAYQAAVRAGYSKTVARTHAWMWVAPERERCVKKYHRVWDIYRKMRDERLEKAGISAQYVLDRHAEIDRMDIIDIMNDDGTIKPVSQWPKAWRVSVNAVEIMELASATDQGDVRAIMKKIKWPDKLKNLEQLGNHVGVQAYRAQMKHEGEIVVFDSDYGQGNND